MKKVSIRIDICAEFHLNTVQGKLTFTAAPPPPPQKNLKNETFLACINIYHILSARTAGAVRSARN